MKKLFIPFFIFFFLSSCTPEGKLNRLLKKYPQLVKTDTLFVSDTTIFERIEHDTLLSIHQIMGSKDTIIIQKDRLTQKIYYYRDSLFVQGECAADTIIKEIPIYFNSINESDTTFSDKLILLFFICLGIFFSILLFRKK